MAQALFRAARYAVDQAVASELEVLAEDCERLSRSRMLIWLMPNPAGWCGKNLPSDELISVLGRTRGSRPSSPPIES